MPKENKRAHSGLEELKDDLKGLPLYPWQSELETILAGEPDERKVFWYSDPKGNSGKTALIRHWILNGHPWDVLVGGAADIRCLYALRKKKNEPFPKVVFWNLAREKNVKLMSYSVVEELKDGMLFSGKSKSTMVMFDAPHVVIMATCEPPYARLAKDRWHVVHLSEDPSSRPTTS